MEIGGHPAALRECRLNISFFSKPALAFMSHIYFDHLQVPPVKPRKDYSGRALFLYCLHLCPFHLIYY